MGVAKRQKEEKVLEKGGLSTEFCVYLTHKAMQRQASLCHF